jgi:hypothetical protein
MLNFGSATKKINILTLVLSKKKILNETKNHNHNTRENALILLI